MKKLYVYADFDWLKEIELIGELGYESLRGSDSYCFTFSKEWLTLYSDGTIAKVKENCLNIWKIRKYVVILHPHFVALCPKHKFN